MRDYQESVTDAGQSDPHICTDMLHRQHTNNNITLYVFLFLSNATFTLPISAVSQRSMNKMGPNRDSVS